MLRWLSFFGALAVVAAGVVFFLYKGPPPTWVAEPQNGVQKHDAEPDVKQAHAENAPPSQTGPWSGEMAITPRAVITGARLTALQDLQVPALHDGELLFLGRELRPGEAAPPDKIFKHEMAYLVTELQPDEAAPPADVVIIKGRQYRPLKKREDLLPGRVRVAYKEKTFLKVDEGTPVKDGDLLALIDPALAVDELESKLAKFEAAESDRVASAAIREYYKAQLNTREALLRTGGATREEVAEARAGYDRYAQETISKGEAVKVAARELRQTETVLRMHEIRSKNDGVVRRPVRHKSEAVRNLDTVLEMVDLSKLRVRARVDLQDLGSLPDPRDPQDKRLVDVEATRMVPPLRILAGTGEVTGVAVSKDGKIISVSDDHTARVWDPNQRGPRITVNQPAALRAVACTGLKAARNLCLTGDVNGLMRLYDLAPQEGKKAFVRDFDKEHRGPVTSVAFSPDGKWAVSGGEDRAVCLWDVESGKLLQHFPAEWGHKQGVTSVAFLATGPEGNTKLSVVSAGRDQTLIVWPLKPDGAPEMADRRPQRGGEVTTLGVSSERGQLLFDQGRELRVLSADDLALVGSLSATSGTSFSRLALFSPEGNLILASAGPGRLGLWRAPTPQTRGHELEQLVWTSSRDDQASTTCGAFDPNGQFFVTGTQNRNVIVWPMPKKEDVERPVTARVFNVDQEVNGGTVMVTFEIDSPPGYLRPGDVVTLVVYPEK